MQVECENCHTRYELSDEFGGRMSRCKCGAQIILPIADPARLLDWACTTTWPRLFKFMTRGGGRGHNQSTITKLIRVFEERRWKEEWRLNGQRDPHKKATHNTRRKLELLRYQQLTQLLELSSREFEVLVADVFRMMGHEAFPVGCSHDGGVDVEIYDPSGNELWAIAQCKRYFDNKIAARHIREFAGAFELSKAQKGYFITTSTFTNQAAATARSYQWLEVLDGAAWLEFMSTAQKMQQETID